jgi:hypothetical protein
MTTSVSTFRLVQKEPVMSMIDARLRRPPQHCRIKLGEIKPAKLATDFQPVLAPSRSDAADTIPSSPVGK